MNGRPTAFVHFRADAPQDDLVSQLRETFGDGGFWLGWQADAISDIQTFDPGEAEQIVDTWQAGLVFSELAEVRWERNSETRYRVWLLTEDSAQTLRDGQPVGDGWWAEDRTRVPRHGIYLWGQYKPKPMDHWVEVRIPRTLKYPIEPDARKEDDFAGVGYMSYLAPNGAAQFVRLTLVAPKRMNR